jgi:hypothetical protein
MNHFQRARRSVTCNRVAGSLMELSPRAMAISMRSSCRMRTHALSRHVSGRLSPVAPSQVPRETCLPRNGTATAAPANPWTNRLHRIMRHFGPNHATGFFTTTDFVSRRVVVPAGATDSLAEPGPAVGPPPFACPHGYAEALRHLEGGSGPRNSGDGQDPPLRQIETIRVSPRFGLERVMQGPVWVGFSDPSALLATRIGAYLTIPRGPEPPHQHGPSIE